MLMKRVSLKKRTVKMDRKLKKTTHATFFGNNEGGCFCFSGKLLMPVGQCTIVWKTTESRESFFNGIAWMIPIFPLSSVIYFKPTRAMKTI